MIKFSRTNVTSSVMTSNPWANLTDRLTDGLARIFLCQISGSWGQDRLEMVEVIRGKLGYVGDYQIFI